MSCSVAPMKVVFDCMTFGLSAPANDANLGL